MRTSRRWLISAVWSCMALMVVGPSVGGRALAQGAPDQLARDLLSNPGPLTEGQVQQIQQYMGAWAEVLRNGEDPQGVREAREAMLSPMRDRLASAAVQNAAMDAILPWLRPALGSEATVVRLNAMIIASEILRGEVADLAVSGLGDPNAAVRYWAAKTIERVASQGAPAAPIFENPQQQRLLAALRVAMGKEGNAEALQEMFAALGALDVPNAMRTLLAVLRERVGMHRDRLTAGLRADQRALRDLQDRVLMSLASGQDISAEQRELARLAARYLQIVVAALQEGSMPEDLQPTAVGIVDVSEQIFKSALSQFDAARAQESVPPLVGPATDGDYDLLLLNTLDWVGTEDSPGILSSSAVNIPYQDLRLPERGGADGAS